MIATDFVYYTNGHGAVAVGFDGEASVFLPNGRLVPLEEPWEEAEEETPSKVTPAQLEAVQDALVARELREQQRVELAEKREQQQAALDEKQEEERQAAVAWVGGLFESDAPTPSSEFDDIDLFNTD